MRLALLLFLLSSIQLVTAGQTPGNTKPSAVVISPSYARFALLVGETAKQSSVVYSTEDTPLGITSITSPVPWIKVTHRKATPSERIASGAANVDQYVIEAAVDTAIGKIGPLAHRVIIKTTNPTTPELTWPITGVIRPAYRVEPSGIVFGELRPTDSSATRTITLRSNDIKNPTAFVVLSAISSTPTVAARVAPSDRAGEYLVFLEVQKSALPGKHEGVVTIKTNSKYPAEKLINFTVTVLP